MEGFRNKGAAAANSRKLSDTWMESLNLQCEKELQTTEKEITRSMVESLRCLKAELESTQWMYRDDFH